MGLRTFLLCAVAYIAAGVFAVRLVRKGVKHWPYALVRAVLPSLLNALLFSPTLMGIDMAGYMPFPALLTVINTALDSVSYTFVHWLNYIILPAAICWAFFFVYEWAVQDEIE